MVLYLECDVLDIERVSCATCSVLIDWSDAYDGLLHRVRRAFQELGKPRHGCTGVAPQPPRYRESDDCLATRSV